MDTGKLLSLSPPRILVIILAIVAAAALCLAVAAGGHPEVLHGALLYHAAKPDSFYHG